MAVRFKQLSKTSTEWTSLNPTLLEGEIGFEKDTKKIKVGDGITAWNNLDYITGSSSSDTDSTNLVDLTSDQTITGIKTFDSVVRTSNIGSQIRGIKLTSDNSNYILGCGVSSENNISDICLLWGKTFVSNAGGGSHIIMIGDCGNVPSSLNCNSIVIGDAHLPQICNYRIALGFGASVTQNNTIQLGQGINNTANTFQVFNYQMLDANGKLPNERLNLGTKKYLHRIKLNLSDQVSGTAPTKMAIIHLDYYSEQETPYTNPNFATIALANSIRCSGYYTDTDTSLTEKNFVYEIALPQSNEFVLNSSFSITTQSTGSSITDEVVGYIFS